MRPDGWSDWLIITNLWEHPRSMAQKAFGSAWAGPT
jgi:hypothetical protein